MKKIFLTLTLILAFVLSINNYVFAVDGIQFITVNEKSMRAYVKGLGDTTIVMLSGWGTESPIDDFMPLADKLSSDYKVVILECFGYGESDITVDERSNQVIVQEIHTALEELKISPPYVLMPHSMSGLYSLYYANNYPSKVLGIIGIDMSLPQKQLERWTEEKFEETKIDQESSDLNISMINQWNKFYDNSKELKDVKYPPCLPVLVFLATEQIENVDDMIKFGTMQTSWTGINTNMITNLDIQNIEILEGKHYLHHNRVDEIVRISKEFIESKVK